MNRLLLLFALICPTAALAAVVPMPRETLAINADAIVIGTIHDATAEPTGRGGPSVITHHDVYVERVLVGSVEVGDLIDVRTAGGPITINGRAMVEAIPDAPVLVEGDHVLLFLYHLDDPRDLHLTRAEQQDLPDSWSILGWGQGLLHLDDLTHQITETDEPLAVAIPSIQSLTLREE